MGDSLLHQACLWLARATGVKWVRLAMYRLNKTYQATKDTLLQATNPSTR